MNAIRTCPGCKQALEPNSVDGLCPKCLMQATLGTGVDVGPDTRGDSPPHSLVAPNPVELGPFFPQLEILELLGRGGMGAVYMACQKQLDHFVALKICYQLVARQPAVPLLKRNCPHISLLNYSKNRDGDVSHSIAGSHPTSDRARRATENYFPPHHPPVNASF